MSERSTASSVAIVGMAGRFPSAPDVERFWENLCAGLDGVTRFSDEDLARAGVAESLRSDPRYVGARGVIEGADLFDAGFFNVGAREAELTDPQHRVFLECAWEALEAAGLDPARYPGPVGVFAGAAHPSYLVHNLVAARVDQRPLLELVGELAALIGNDKDHLTTRVAYKLGLRGPAITVQSACSTSLVAVALACQSLLAFQCDAALAGGVSLTFPRGEGYLAQEGHILSPDGRCRAFDVSAAGTVPGEGVGVVVLKRLDDALADGDHIHAVILAAALNNDGAAKVGYTAPGVDGQVEVITTAHSLADVDASTIAPRRGPRHGHGARRSHRGRGAHARVRARRGEELSVLPREREGRRGAPQHGRGRDRAGEGRARRRARDDPAGVPLHGAQPEARPRARRLRDSLAAGPRGPRPQRLAARA